MARMPGATFHRVRNYTADGQQSVRGVVVHIMAGTLEGSQAWFNNATAQASSHFGTGKDGELRQWVDTADRAWAQSAGNRDWLSVENEGVGGDALTDAQITANARVLAWAHREYGVPLQLAKSPSDRGLGYHAMGGAAWGGHTSCPGPKIVAQLPTIVARAKALVANTQETPVADLTAKDVWLYKGKDETSDVYAYVRNTKAVVDDIKADVIRVGGQVAEQRTTLTAIFTLLKSVSDRLDALEAK
ncbi:peptidoglycan recognition protein family protein [Streptomyces drozdowiczii]|uniref:N-acetylmuramoyl-L-alanine amidase n=1 Tax=Streptomyces drozdowiczii TaxID=202862 RepID=A0ABY6PPR8_9ACTN|nr:peptidoglycan recognition family protein [Streptomyces drozdowiczii]MCX0246426.1 N-acetylmuramoyl-L-alanine amidase [Streptomyces drozdowiczii]UZK54071.1 N-acetylmuramoyl-L-alanine amidase [Streptomyces drozdowiczii]